MSTPRLALFLLLFSACGQSGGDSPSNGGEDAVSMIFPDDDYGGGYGLPFCGNMKPERGEVCDGNWKGCVTPDGYVGVSLCNDDCKGWGDCESAEYCGDGILNGTEVCDSVVYIPGAACAADCQSIKCLNPAAIPTSSGCPKAPGMPPFGSPDFAACSEGYYRFDINGSSKFLAICLGRPDWIGNELVIRFMNSANPGDSAQYFDIHAGALGLYDAEMSHVECPAMLASSALRNALKEFEVEGVVVQRAIVADSNFIRLDGILSMDNGLLRLTGLRAYWRNPGITSYQTIEATYSGYISK